MKRVLSFLLVFVFILVVFVGCSGKGDVVTSSSVPSEQTSSVSAGASSVDPKAIMDSILAEISFTHTIILSEGDLSSSSVVNMDNIEVLAGVQSNIYTEDGGMVWVIVAKDGKADTLKTELETYRTAQVDFLELYPEFQNGVANMKEARIIVKGNVVVLASAPTGHEGGYPALDTAVENALA